MFKNILIKILKDNSLYKYRSAKILARGPKRLDICSAQFAHGLHLCKNISLQDKVCLEIGSGWVLTHALVAHLLGAKRVIAIDLNKYLRPEVLSFAVKESITSVVRDILAPFESHQILRDRLYHLLKIKEFDLEVLAELGIEYRAPFDLLKDNLGESVDFIYSASVLEHIPHKIVPNLLFKLSDCLKTQGFMMHMIHLEDHQDIQNKPFEFLKLPCSSYSEEMESRRGNRIRASHWQTLFNSLKNCSSEVLYKYSREIELLPEKLELEGIENESTEDLLISHLGIKVSKQ